MNNSNKHGEGILKQMSFICETILISEYQIGEKDISLSLIELKSSEEISCGYAMLAKSGSGQVVCMLGCSLSEGKNIFRKLADGQVSPCNMKDVIEDMMSPCAKL